MPQSKWPRSTHYRSWNAVFQDIRYTIEWVEETRYVLEQNDREGDRFSGRMLFYLDRELALLDRFITPPSLVAARKAQVGTLLCALAEDVLAARRRWGWPVADDDMRAQIVRICLADQQYRGRYAIGSTYPHQRRRAAR